MSETEKFLYTVGELLATEIEEVAEVKYKRGDVTHLYLVMQNGKNIAVKLEEL